MTVRRPRSLPKRIGDLPIFWKLLLPFLLLLLLVCSAGAYVIVRDIAAKSASAVREQATVRALDARSRFHDSELDVLESANYASNLEGMATGVAERDRSSVSSLLASVQALKPDLAYVAVTDAQGRPIAELGGSSIDWVSTNPVAAAVASRGSSKTSGFVRAVDRTLMVMVAPICTSARCEPIGYALAGVDLGSIATRLTNRSDSRVTIFGPDGTSLTAPKNTPPPERTPGDTDIVQVRHSDFATAYTTFTLTGKPAGVLAVTIPAERALSSVRGPALRLVGVLLLAMIAAVAVGTAVSRLITRQLRSLVHTSRVLGNGDLSARAPILAEDEHGELAAAFNKMAEQLEAERSSLELQVEQRTEEIRRLLNDRTEFFAGLSHELRTPLAVIATQAEMLDDTDAREAIRQSATQLLELINDILDLARGEAGTVELHAAPISTVAFFESITPMLVRLGAAAEVEVHVDVPRRTPPVIADAAAVQQIVVNLVDNAIKYTPGGGRVDVVVTRVGEFVCVAVVDTGVGIPDDVGERVFEPFYRVPSTSPQQNQASTGLGLALVKRAVEAHGGTVTWKSAISGGTEFSFTLPVAPLGTRKRSRRASLTSA